LGSVGEEVITEVSHAGTGSSSHGADGSDGDTVQGRDTVPAGARLLAVACLLLVPLGLAFVAFGFVRGLPDLAVSLVLVVVAGLLLWTGLGRRGLVRGVCLAVAALAVVAAVWSTVDSGRQVLWIVVGVLIEAIGGACGRGALLSAPLPHRHRLHRVRSTPAKPVLFVNPHSGGGTAERVGLAAAARSQGIEVHELQRGDDLTAMVRQAVADGADCLGAAGGDGTQAQVALVCIDEHLPFVCIPAGTRNHFALDLGLDRNDPLGGLSAFTDAYSKVIDVGEVNGALFLNNVSIGAYGEVVADEQYRDRKVGTALSKLPDLIGPDSTPLDLRFTDGDGQAHESALVLHVSNNVYDLSPRGGFGSRPSLSDGMLGVIAVVQSGGLAAPVRVVRWQTPTFRIESDAEVLGGLDGEARELDTPVEFRIRPGVLDVRIPVDATGLSPSALRPTLTRNTLDRMVSIAGGRRPAE